MTAMSRTGGSQLSPLYGGFNSDLYLYRLRAHFVGVRLWNPDLALARDPAIFEKMLRDTTIRQGIEGRQRRAAGTTWNVQPPRRATEADEKLAAVVQDGLEEIECFQEARYTLATALLRGNRYAWIDGERKRIKLGEDSVARDWWMPTKFNDIDGRRFRYIPDDKIRAGKAKGLVPKSSRQIAPVGMNAGLWVDVPDDAPLVHVEFNEEEGRLRYGRGLAESLYHVFWMKIKCLEEYASFLEKWGQGMVVGKIGAKTAQDLSDRGSDQATSQLIDRMMNIIDRMRARNAVVFDEQDDMEVIFPGAGAHDVFQSALTYFDNSATRLIDGALLPSGGGSKTGSLARGKVEEDSVEQVSQLDRRILDASMTRDVIGAFLRHNRAQLAAAKLEQARRPRFVTSQEKKANPTIEIDKYVKAHAMGYPTVADDFYTKTDIVKPTPDDELMSDLAKEMDAEFFEMKNSSGEAGTPENGSAGNQPKDEGNQPQNQQRRGSTTGAKAPSGKA